MSKPNKDETVDKVDCGSMEWNQYMAILLTSSSSADRIAELDQVLQKACHYDHCVVFAFKDDFTPIDLHSSFSPEQHQVFVNDYQAGPYLLDPFYLSCIEQKQPGLYRMRQIAPDHFYLSEYFLSYYKRTGLTEEIGFFVQVTDDVMIVLSLMRDAQHAKFSDEDIEVLKRVEPIVSAVVASHWKEMHIEHTGSDDKALIHAKINQCFQEFGGEILTPREQQISQMLLRGHSSISVANTLSISAGTVKIHRKNIYSKLNISSQAELLSLFLKQLSD